MIRPIEMQDDDVWSMFQASRSGDLEQVKALVARRGPNWRDWEYNYTPPLHFAVREGHLEIVRFLLEQGADLAYRAYPFQDSLVTMAQDREHHDVARLLLETVRRRFPVKENISGFLDAARDGDLARVQADLAHDPSLAAGSDDTGETALHRGGHGRTPSRDECAARRGGECGCGSRRRSPAHSLRAPQPRPAARRSSGRYASGARCRVQHLSGGGFRRRRLRTRGAGARSVAGEFRGYVASAAHLGGRAAQRP